MSVNLAPELPTANALEGMTSSAHALVVNEQRAVKDKIATDTVAELIPLDSSLFPFKPRLNKTSRKIAETAGSFLERQEAFLRRRQEQVENEEHAGHGQKRRVSSQSSLPLVNQRPGEGRDQQPKNDVKSPTRPKSSSTARQFRHYSQKAEGERLRTASLESESSTSSLPKRSIRRSQSTAAICSCTSLACDHPSHFKPDEKKKPVVIDANRKKTIELQKELRDKIFTAAKKRRIFTIYGRPNQYSDIRNVLLERGWVERPPPTDDDTVTFRSNLNGIRPIRGYRPNSPRKPENDGSDSDSDTDDDTGDDQVLDEDCAKVAMQNTTRRLGNKFVGHEDAVASALSECQVSFIWSSRHCKHIDRQSLKDDQMTNGFRHTWCFTTKLGLTQTLRGLGGFASVDPDSFYPKCFDLSNSEDREAFVKYFVKVSATSILKIYSKHNVPCGVLLHALAIVKEYIKERNHDDIDVMTTSNATPDQVLDADTHAMLLFLYNTLGDGTDVAPFLEEPPLSRDLSRKVESTSPLKNVQDAIDNHNRASNPGNEDGAPKPEQAKAKYLYTSSFRKELIAGENRLKEWSNLKSSLPPDLDASICDTLNKAAQFDLQFENQGTRNIWVIKPGAKSRGRGIFCENRLDLILHAASNANKKDKLVAQKYIEKPLLVHQTKFDIRQYYVVTCWSPLTIYFYKNCYIRFSSSKFDLSDLRSQEARFRHLCNNAIQEDSNTFDNDSWNEGCMWDSDQFKSYLVEQGQVAVWEAVVYPKMKEIINLTMMASQETVVPRKGSFELYGADFMLDESFLPWLIEINVSPSLSKSTPATDKLVTSCLVDTMNLALDRKPQKNNLGDFELSLQQPKVKNLLNVGALCVDGVHIRKPRKPNTGVNARVPTSPRKLKEKIMPQTCNCTSVSCGHPSHRVSPTKQRQTVRKGEHQASLGQMASQLRTIVDNSPSSATTDTRRVSSARARKKADSSINNQINGKGNVPQGYQSPSVEPVSPSLINGEKGQSSLDSSTTSLTEIRLNKNESCDTRARVHPCRTPVFNLTALPRVKAEQPATNSTSGVQREIEKSILFNIPSRVGMPTREFAFGINGKNYSNTQISPTRPKSGRTKNVGPKSYAQAAAHFPNVDARSRRSFGVDMSRSNPLIIRGAQSRT